MPATFHRLALALPLLFAILSLLLHATLSAKVIGIIPAARPGPGAKAILAVVDTASNTILKQSLVPLAAKYRLSAFSSSAGAVEFFTAGGKTAPTQMGQYLTSNLSFIAGSMANLSNSAGYIWSKLIHVGDKNDWAVFTPLDGTYKANLAQVAWGTGKIAAKIALPPKFYQGGVADSKGNVYLLSTGRTSQVGAVTSVSTNPLKLGTSYPVSCPFMVEPPSSKRSPFFTAISNLGLVGDEVFGVYSPATLFSINLRTRVCTAYMNLTCDLPEDDYTHVDNVVYDTPSSTLYAFLSNVDGDDDPYSCSVTLNLSQKPLNPIASPKTQVLGLGIPVLVS